ncbi:hypothetical protein C8235_10690 [Paracidovorax avenae]|nr:hypothetical protein C8235_10690 [Paracidovorax avenae]
MKDCARSTAPASNSRPFADNALGLQDEPGFQLGGIVVTAGAGIELGHELANALPDPRRVDADALVGGTGEVFGAYVIESLDEGRSILMGDGSPRRVEFSITLQRKPDDQADPAGGAEPAEDSADWWQ